MFEVQEISLQADHVHICVITTKQKIVECRRRDLIIIVGPVSGKDDFTVEGHAFVCVSILTMINITTAI